MSVLTRKLKLSINRKLINKNEGNDKSLFAEGWINRSLTPKQLADSINKGIAYCCQLDGLRKSANFLCSDIISVDIDGTRRIDEMMCDPIVERFLTIFYTTPSHTNEQHRFRLIFALPRTIDSRDEMVAASRSLTLRLNGDRGATDAARIFYGSRGSNPQIFDRGIDAALLDELTKQGLDTDHSDTKGSAVTASSVSKLTVAAELPIKTGYGKTLPFSQIDFGTAVCCPFHHDEHASAFVLKSRTGTRGLHCSTCAQTFWLEGTTIPSYDFFDFDKRVREVKAYFDKHHDLGPLKDLFVNEDPIHEGLTDANIAITSSKYLTLNRINDGLTLIKSPKGTGKTERLSAVLDADPGSVLLIGHRVALIRQSCARLKLECYLDFDGPIDRLRVGICLDSLQRLRSRTGTANIFKTIIIDESEQVLSHFLSQTMDSEGRDREAIFILFKMLIQRAKRVIALDADLSWLTFETLTKMRNERPAHSPPPAAPRLTHIILNDHPVDKTIAIFQSESHLLADLKQAIDNKKRVFVTSNSKRRIDNLNAAIAADFEGTVRGLLITSATKDDPPVKAFIETPSKQALRYSVILTSPSLGTGVDIAFPDDAQEIDVVYGFFDALITTHFDCDQQLARVRHPGAVKVWISPRRFNFDTAVDVIRKDIQVSNSYKNLLVGYDALGRPTYLDDDPLLDMAIADRVAATSFEEQSKKAFSRS
ncbi:hypothetical protein ABIF65_011805 [Bradyrhizobium japonicum]